MALRAGRRGARRPLPPPPDPARRPARPSPRRDRPGARRRGDLVERRQLAPAAVRRRGRTGPPGIGDEGPVAHDRRRARRRRRQPAPAALHRPFDARPTRLHRAHASAGPDDGDAGGDAPEPHRPPRRRRDRSSVRSADDDIAALVAPPRRRAHAGARRADRGTRAAASRSRSTSSPAAPATSRDGCRRSTPT